MRARRFWASSAEPHRYASTIVGDVANTASRIEGLNKQLGTRLLASEEALDQVTGFVLRPSEFLLAGKSEPIRVSEVMGALRDPSRAALASAFAEAFDAFQSHAWDESVRTLEALLRSYPDDGPSRYLLSRALRFRAAPKEAPAVLVARVGKA